ncbi:MAG TPA: hypothetical protein VMW76_02980 [Bacteroidales bacterium]|nr:hypothetical protein [Bacteroidales bacterium]
MLLKLYRGIGPGTGLIILITAVLIWIQDFIDPVTPGYYHDIDPMPLYELFLRLLSGRQLIVTMLIFIMVLIISAYLVRFNTRLFFINERTFLPASLYILLSGYLPGLQVCYPVVPAALFLLIALDRIISSYRKPGVAYNFFDAALLIGIGSMFYFNVIWFYLIVIIGILLIRTINMREITISLFGLITPYLVLYAYYYIAGKDINLLNKLLLSNITTIVPEYYWSPLLIILSILNSLILIIAMLHLWRGFNKKKVQSRKTFSILIWILLIATGVYLLVPTVSIEMMYIFLVPLVYIVTHFLIFLRNKKIANIIFVIILLSVIILNVF